MHEAVIVDVVRTGSGRGKGGGALADTHPGELLATVLGALLERNSLDGHEVDDVIAGCVSQVGDQALNIARTAALAAGLPETVPGTTVDRQCGSSQQAVHFAAQGVMAGAYEVVIACGVESMSRVQMGAANSGGDPLQPLVPRYPEGLVNQGVSAELIAARWKWSREDLDEYSARSHQRAATAAAAGWFDREIVPVGPHRHDETIRGNTTPEGLSALRAAFRSEDLAERFPEIEWAITPGNSSPLTDGASAALIMSAERAVALGLRPRARFRSFAVTGSDPFLMLTGVIPATQMALRRAGLSIEKIDAFEVNEAFAPVPLTWAREFDVDEARVNPRGGAIALGHPLGASGIRLLTTMVHHLEDTNGSLGLQTMCEGGGMANATIIEVLG
ncbi:thiolase family protein [Nocardioides sp.]|uniref:thiolase family protein n=1 Tax=Nocardioides sp. TaxID=35761 RepID=UPI003D09AE16